MNHDQVKKLIGDAIAHAIVGSGCLEVVGVSFVVIFADGSGHVRLEGGLMSQPGVQPEFISACALEFHVEATKSGTEYSNPRRVEAGGGS